MWPAEDIPAIPEPMPTTRSTSDPFRACPLDPFQNFEPPSHTGPES